MCLQPKPSLLVVVWCTYTFTLSITMKNVQTIIQVVNQSLIWCDFDWKLYEFKLTMMTQVCNFLAPFLAFLKSYIHAKHTTCWLSCLTHGSKTWGNVICHFVCNLLQFKLLQNMILNWLFVFISSVLMIYSSGNLFQTIISSSELKFSIMWFSIIKNWPSYVCVGSYK
jgi:hypothetical protein